MVEDKKVKRREFKCKTAGGFVKRERVGETAAFDELVGLIADQDRSIIKWIVFKWIVLKWIVLKWLGGTERRGNKERCRQLDRSKWLAKKVKQQ